MVVYKAEEGGRRSKGRPSRKCKFRVLEVLSSRGTHILGGRKTSKREDNLAQSGEWQKQLEGDAQTTWIKICKAKQFCCK